VTPAAALSDTCIREAVTAQDQPAAPPQDPEHFRERSNIVLNVFEYTDAHDFVEALVFECQRVCGHVMVGDVRMRVPPGRARDPVAIRVDGINLGAETCYPVAVVPITAPDIKDTLASTRIEPIDHSIAFICAPKVQRPYQVGEMPYEAGHR
jgi:hypothetical protein